MTNKNLLTNNGVKTKTSVEVADMVGKRHADLMRDIRGYIDDLSEKSESADLRSQNSSININDYFIESTYQGKRRKEKCYLITEKGCEFIANKLTGKKGSEFTAKYVEAFHEMKDTIKKVDNTVKKKGSLSESDWNKITKKSKYLTESVHDRKSTREFLDNYDRLRLNEAIDYIYDILKQAKGSVKYDIFDTAVRKLKKMDSELDFSNPMNTYIKTMCEQGIIKLNELHIKKLKTVKSNNDNKIKELQAELNDCPRQSREPKLEDMVEIHKHPFAFNSMYVADRFGRFDRKKSDSYKSWINTFSTYEVMDIDYWIDKGVDFDLPIKLYLYFVTYKERNFDTDGLIKSAQDMIFNRCMNIDDNIVECVEAKQIGKCSSYDAGKIYYYIENITD